MCSTNRLNSTSHFTLIDIIFNKSDKAVILAEILKMNCLHICNDLLGSKVHENLYNYLELNSEFNQVVFYPSRSNKIKKVQSFISEAKFKVIASKPLKGYHSFLFRNKIRHLYDDLLQKVDIDNIQIVHATTLFSDGAIALKLHKNYGIPYIVAVRGTDINIFLKYRPDLIFLLKEIVTHSSKLVFISKSLENNFFKHKLIRPFLSEIQDKCEIIHNGIDNYWLNHQSRSNCIDPQKILYIGKFDRNKNVLRLLESIFLLRRKYPELKIDLVGGGGSQEEEIKKLALQYPDIINLLGPVYDKNKLLEIIRSNHIFAMVSIGETFGLVYVEALTQGLPILYTKDQGIDGTFKYNVGESVDALEVSSITTGLEKIISGYNSYTSNNIDFSVFGWTTISRKYIQLYQNCLQKS